MNRLFNIVSFSVSVIIIVSIFNCSSKLLNTNSTRAKLGYNSAIHNELISLPQPKDKLVVAVYKFRDQTGQYKSSSTGMTWSTAVSQGITSVLLKSLEDSGWFVTLEREGLSNLLNERRIIRQTRSQYQTENENSAFKLPPLLYAGIMLEGGIISYETNTLTGGFGAKYFGLGGHTQFRRDEVTVYLRAVSTQNGRILKTIYTTKSILSMMVDVGLYRYVRVKRLLEIETGFSINEPVNMCVTEAIDKAVYSLIIEGVLGQLWGLENPGDIKSPLIQKYLKEKEQNEQLVQFDKDGQIIQLSNNYNSLNIVNNRFGLGLNFSTTYCVGDYPDPRFRMAGDICFRYGITPWFSLQFNGEIGQLGDKNNFETVFSSVDLRTVFSLLPKHRLAPFIFIGGGGLYFKAKDKYGNEIETNKSGYMGWKPVIVSGMGVEYFVNRNWGFTFNIQNNFTFTDELDGITYGNRDDSIWGGKIGVIHYIGN